MSKTKTIKLQDGVEPMLSKLGWKRRESHSETINRLIVDAHTAEYPETADEWRDYVGAIEVKGTDFSHFRQVRMSYAQYKKMETRATEEGISTNEWIRKLIDNA